MPAVEDRSLGQLVRELSHESSTLVRQEVDLAKTELREKVSLVGTNVGSIALGGGVAFLGGLALLTAVITGLTALLDQMMPTGVAMWLAPLVVGLALVAFGYSYMQKGLKTLREEGVAPRETTQSLQENKAWLKAKIS